MGPRRPGAFAAALLAGACSPGVSGVVRDAGTNAPVAGAVVELGSVGWGVRDGQVVWDAAKTERTTTDAAGAFAFAADGGSALRVVAAGRPPVETSVCPRSPSLVRVGGPYPQLHAGERLLFDAAGDGAWASEFGLTAAGDAFGDGRELRLEAPGGVRFVAGTGTIPPAPPLPYPRAVELDLTNDCGWLFVADATGPVAAVRVGPLGWEQDPGGPRRSVMLFAPLPRAGAPAER